MAQELRTTIEEVMGLLDGKPPQQKSSHEHPRQQR
jgi:hypothetical protein